MADYAALLDEFENDNPFKANYRVSLSDLSQMAAMSQKFQSIPGVYSVTAPIEMTNDLRGGPAGRHQGGPRSSCWC